MIRRQNLASVMLLFGILATVTSALAQQPPSTPAIPRFADFHAASPVISNATTQIQPRRASAKAATAVGDRCTTIDFEGLGDSQFVPDFDDVSLPGWISTIEDTQPGGHGNFSNEPSPVTTVFWSSQFGNPTARDILFGSPVSSVSFHYASAFAVSLQAFDVDGNLLTTSNGARNGPNNANRYTTFSPLSVATIGDKIAKVTFHGFADFTGIDNLKVCRRPKIHGVEVTQAIQEYQKIADLEAALAGGDPPVPIVAGKPAALRVYFDEMQVATPIIVEADIDGNIATKSAVIPPGCKFDKQRVRGTGCSSVDFHFTPPGGAWTAIVKLKDADDTELEAHVLPFVSRAPEFIHLRAVTVCDGIDAGGDWECEDNAVLPGLIDKLRRTAPTASVTAGVTNNVVRFDRALYPSNDGGFAWWVAMVAGVNRINGLFDWTAAQLGVRNYYFGIVSENRAPGGIGGIVHAIPGRAGAGRNKAERLGVETNAEVVAHETGHMLGRKHTNNAVPAAVGNVPPGCYNFAQDSSTDWPYANTRIQSATKLEVGFDVAADKALDPQNTYDWMSYCTPRWISPFTYVHEMTEALNGAASAPAQLAKAAALVGAFWTVSGTISGGTATLDPVFVRDVEGPTAMGSGTYSIVVKNGGGSALFTRLFTPAEPHSESVGPEVGGLLTYFELIPVQAGAAQIVVLAPGSVEIASVLLAGAAPGVAFTSPAPGAILNGQRNIQWTITDPDSSAFESALEYSADGGLTWLSLGHTNQSVLRVDFDQLPGSDGHALLRVFVSDGAHTGSAVSPAFAVPSHAPTVAILDNERSYFRLGDLVWLRANAHDRDDGVLDGSAVQWLSSRDGPLGAGASLPVYTLTAGTHTITVIATDSDGNSSRASEQITVAAVGPSVALTPHGLEVIGARSCVEITVDATAGSPGVPLAAVGISVDGGASFFDITDFPRPYTFLPIGTGARFWHIVVHAFDAAGYWDVKDVRYFTAAPCNAPNVAPVADAGDDRTVPAPGGTAALLLDGSGSTDPDSPYPGNGDIVAFDWFKDYGQPGETPLGSGQQVQVMLGVGVHQVALRVTDSGNLTSVAQVTITVQAAPVASGTAIVPSVNPIVAGQGVSFTATVSGSNPAGAVTFKDGVAVLCNAVPLVSGQAQCAAGALAVGSHGITAEYAGDAANSPSTSPAVTQVVSKAGTGVSIGAHTPNPSVSGAPVAVTANVAVLAPGAGTPTGTVTVTDGSVSCPITLPATSCELVLTGDGLRALSATYSGNAGLTGSTSPLVAHIVGVPTATLDIDASVTETRYDAHSDGLIVIRYLFGLRGPALTANALGGTASRTDPADVKNYLDGINLALDVDGNGTPDALTDGLMIIRYLFGLRGNALVAGAIAQTPPPTRTDPQDIADYIQSLMP